MSLKNITSHEIMASLIGVTANIEPFTKNIPNVISSTNMNNSPSISMDVVQDVSSSIECKYNKSVPINCLNSSDMRPGPSARSSTSVGFHPYPSRHEINTTTTTCNSMRVVTIYTSDSATTSQTSNETFLPSVSDDAPESRKWRLEVFKRDQIIDRLRYDLASFQNGELNKYKIFLEEKNKKLDGLIDILTATLAERNKSVIDKDLEIESLRTRINSNIDKEMENVHKKLLAEILNKDNQITEYKHEIQNIKNNHKEELITSKKILDNLQKVNEATILVKDKIITEKTAEWVHTKLQLMTANQQVTEKINEIESLKVQLMEKEKITTAQYEVIRKAYLTTKGKCSIINHSLLQKEHIILTLNNNYESLLKMRKHDLVQNDLKINDMTKNFSKILTIEKMRINKALNLFVEHFNKLILQNNIEFSHLPLQSLLNFQNQPQENHTTTANLMKRRRFSI